MNYFLYSSIFCSFGLSYEIILTSRRKKGGNCVYKLRMKKRVCMCVCVLPSLSPFLFYWSITVFFHPSIAYEVVNLVSCMGCCSNSLEIQFVEIEPHGWRRLYGGQIYWWVGGRVCTVLVPKFHPDKKRWRCLRGTIGLTHPLGRQAAWTVLAQTEFLSSYRSILLSAAESEKNKTK